MDTPIPENIVGIIDKSGDDERLWIPRFLLHENDQASAGQAGRGMARGYDSPVLDISQQGNWCLFNYSLFPLNPEK